MMRRILAWLRWSKSAVCTESFGRGLYDFHDYPDSTTPEPWHFAEHTCVRCGKKFCI